MDPALFDLNAAAEESYWWFARLFPDVEFLHGAAPTDLGDLVDRADTYSVMGVLEEIAAEHPLTARRDLQGSKLRFRHGIRSLIELRRIRRRYR